MRSSSCQVPMLVDTMSNAFQAQYAAWPFRYYVFQGDRILFKAEPRPDSLTYNVKELTSVLTNLLHA